MNMKSAHDVVFKIEALGSRLAALQISQTSNLKLNLGLSNLGLQYQDSKFQNAFSSILSELQATYEEYKKNSAETHWNLRAVVDEVEKATGLIHEILEELTDNPYKILDPAIYLNRFSALQKPFAHIGSANNFDPIYISIHYGMTYTDSLHGYESDSTYNSGNSLVRINQYLNLLNSIQRSYEFIQKRIDGDAQEIVSNLDAANEVPQLGRKGPTGGITYSGAQQNVWSEDFLPMDELAKTIETELFFIERLYLNVNADGANWDDMLWHLESLFHRDRVETMTSYFAEEDRVLANLSDSDEKIVDYDGISVGLTKVRDLEQAYEDWYQEFQKCKKFTL